MAFLLPFVPHAIAAVASAVSGGAASYYFWKKYKEPEEIKNDIIKLTKERRVRIIFVGPNGAGKSSLINTFQSAYENKRIKQAETKSKSETVTITFEDYIIKDNEHPIIDLLDTSGFDVTGKKDEAVLQNIIAAFDGKLPYKRDMTVSGAVGDKPVTKPINIVVFVYSTQTILGAQEISNPESCLHSLHDYVTKSNLCNILVLTHADTTEKTTEKEVIKTAKEKLGFDAGDIFLIKNLVDHKGEKESDKKIPTADRVQALGVLYAITNDGVEKQKVIESRETDRETFD